MAQKFHFHTAANTEPSTPASDIQTTQPADIRKTVDKLESKKDHLMEIKYIPRARIKANQKNRYPASAVNELAESILHYGLQQPITVVYLLAEDLYIVESGHQRVAALDQLISEHRDQEPIDPEYEKNVKSCERGYPCIIQDRLSDEIDLGIYESEDLSQLPESVIDSEIRLIITNEVKRPDDPIVKAKNVKRLNNLYERKNQGKKRTEKININKQIAADLNLTERQVKNYKSLDQLIPELREEFEKNHLSLKNGTLIAKLDEEDQQKLLNLIRSGAALKTDQITTLLHEKEKLLKQIEEKENKIKALSAANHDEILEGKKEQIKALQDEINLLRSQNQTPKTLSDQANTLIHSDMAVRAAFSGAENAISLLLKQIDLYLSLDFSDAGQIPLLTEFEISEQCQNLTSMISPRIIR